MPSSSKVAVIAAAGSGKTEFIVETALASSDRVLITTYTNENLGQIVKRLQEKAGAIPANVTVMPWFTFLLSQGARPYQAALTKAVGRVRSLNFVAQPSMYIPRTKLSYFLDSGNDIYSDRLADFVCEVNNVTGGQVVRRLEAVFDQILIDEMQDLVGYDLQVLDLLLKSSIGLTLVGDPRQHTYSTSRTSKNKKYQGAGLLKWLEERDTLCAANPRTFSYRCNQAICDFADALFPAMPATESRNAVRTGHDGIFRIAPEDVPAYAAEHKPTVLRYAKSTKTMGLPAINIGVSKGSTYDRVLIFPTKRMLTYLRDGDPSKLSPDKLYVAVTRARYSVAFVVPKK